MWQTWHATGGAQHVTHSGWLVDSVYRGQTEDEEGTSGAHVPRRPIQPLNTSGAALDLPRAADHPPSFIHVI